jgi:hypothetical protein
MTSIKNKIEKKMSLGEKKVVLFKKFFVEKMAQSCHIYEETKLNFPNLNII